MNTAPTKEISRTIYFENETLNIGWLFESYRFLSIPILARYMDERHDLEFCLFDRHRVPFRSETKIAVGLLALPMNEPRNTFALPLHSWPTVRNPPVWGYLHMTVRAFGERGKYMDPTLIGCWCWFTYATSPSFVSQQPSEFDISPICANSLFLTHVTFWCSKDSRQNIHLLARNIPWKHW